MKVHELIKELGQYHPDDEIIVFDREYGFNLAGSVYSYDYAVSEKYPEIIVDGYYKGKFIKKSGVVIDR